MRLRQIGQNYYLRIRMLQVSTEERLAMQGESNECEYATVTTTRGKRSESEGGLVVCGMVWMMVKG
jgi:hypothetical protein